MGVRKYKSRLGMMRNYNGDMIFEEMAIREFLACHPSLEQVLAIRASEELQERASELLSRNKHSPLTQSEEAELDQIFALEHLVRMVKAEAFEKLARQK